MGGVFEDPDRKVELFGGQVDYIVCTGALKALDCLKGRNLGLMCTGLIGETPKAACAQRAEHTAADYYDKELRSRMFPVPIPDSQKAVYDNFEQFNLYEHSFNKYLLSVLVRQQEVEVASPYVDVDYLDFIFKVPVAYRYGCKYVKAWINTKYPKAAQYIWQYNGKPVSEEISFAQRFKFYKYKLRDVFVRARNKIARMAGNRRQLYQERDMNPTEKWYWNSRDFREFVLSYYKANIGRVKSKGMKTSLARMFHHGNAQEKLEVVNLLAIYKLYL